MDNYGGQGYGGGDQGYGGNQGYGGDRRDDFQGEHLDISISRFRGCYASFCRDELCSWCSRLFFTSATLEATPPLLLPLAEIMGSPNGSLEIQLGIMNQLLTFISWL
jgi:hypothetical protein